MFCAYGRRRRATPRGFDRRVYTWLAVREAVTLTQVDPQTHTSQIRKASGKAGDAPRPANPPLLSGSCYRRDGTCGAGPGDRSRAQCSGRGGIGHACRRRRAPRDTVIARGRAERGRASPQPSAPPPEVILGRPPSDQWACSKLADELLQSIWGLRRMPGVLAIFGDLKPVPARLHCSPHALGLAFAGPAGDVCLTKELGAQCLFTPAAMKGTRATIARMCAHLRGRLLCAVGRDAKHTLQHAGQGPAL